MTNSDRDQELLQKYMAHLLPEDDERLKQIKQHVGSEIFRSRQKSTLKKRASRFYMASIISVLLCLGTFGGYRFLLQNQLSGSHAISNVFGLHLLNKIQNPEVIAVLFVLFAVFLICAIIFLWRGLASQKKSKRL